MFYLIAKPCTHWGAEKNRRFSLVRFKCDTWNETRRSSGAIWDKQERTWGEFSRIDERGHWVFTREATEAEVMKITERKLI